MALTDLILKAKINMGLMRAPHISAANIGVQVTDGCVTLTGDLDDEQQCQAADAIARSVVGVTAVDNQMTCGVHIKADTVELVTLRFLEKLDDAWSNLPDDHALTQADYLRWALWMVYKFHIPPNLGDGNNAKIEAKTVEQALTRIADYVGAPKALVALEMIRQAELLEEPLHPHAPEIANAPLVATPRSEEEAVKTLASHTARR